MINHHWSDVRIYLLHDGIDERLGMVTAASTKSFPLSWRYFASGGTVRLRAHPVGNPRSLFSEGILVRPGQEIEWVLEEQLGRSSLSVN